MIGRILVALLLTGSSPVSAQSLANKQQAAAELQRVRALAQASVPEFRDAVRPMLTDGERQIEAATKIEIVESWEVQACASVDHGQRVIEVNAGLLDVLDWISTALAAIAGAHPFCANSYITYVFSEIDTNSRSMALGEDMDRVYPPFQYAERHPEACAGVTEALITQDPDAKQKRMIALGSSMTWILAHELAHHLHGDTNLQFDNPPTAEQLRRSRENEYRADKLAFRMLSQPGFSPSGALPAYLFIGIRGAAAEAEKESTHPSGPQRFRILFDALQSQINDPGFHAYLRSSGQLGRWQEAIEKMRKFVQQ